jgi:ring-1,2-phenylacetyl-CoA epoxidase subunit PaaD
MVATLTEKEILDALLAVTDPEIPVISVVDLGIISSVKIEGGSVSITMTPTFTACPANDLMRDQIQECVAAMEGVDECEVLVDFTIPWDSNRISETGRQQLKDFGLAPPPKHKGDISMELVENTTCPHCDSDNTSMDTIFGPTLCRSMHYCHNCKQAFQQFKPVG